MYVLENVDYTSISDLIDLLRLTPQRENENSQTRARLETLLIWFLFDL